MSWKSQAFIYFLSFINNNNDYRKKLVEQIEIVYCQHHQLQQLSLLPSKWCHCAWYEFDYCLHRLDQKHNASFSCRHFHRLQIRRLPMLPSMYIMAEDMVPASIRNGSNRPTFQFPCVSCARTTISMSTSVICARASVPASRPAQKHHFLLILTTTQVTTICE